MNPARAAAQVDAVVVGIPAHNEADLLGRCLASVVASAQAAVAAAQTGGQLRRIHLVVVSHRSIDDTAATGRRALMTSGAITGEVVIDSESELVAQVRNLALRRGLSRIEHDLRAGRRHRVWLLTTDADTEVPVSWIPDILGHAKAGAEAVAGLVDVDLRGVPCHVRVAYAREVARGLSDAGHWHAYGANLAIRADVFERLGGFPHRLVGEDVGLVSALRSAGVVIASPGDLRVKTSNRSPGRVPGGLGSLLAQLTTETPALHPAADGPLTATAPESWPPQSPGALPR